MDGMMEKEGEKWAALLGCSGTKRKTFLEHAARSEGLSLLFIDWKAWNQKFWKEWLDDHGGKGIIKIDPPIWESAALDVFPVLAADYRKNLELLDTMGKASGYSFFNHPGAILRLLDKRACKQELAFSGLAVTEELPAADTLEELLTVMEERRISQVFIKPNYGSGALGVTAFRVCPKTGKMVLYTCAFWNPQENCLMNTKKMRRLEEREDILVFLSRLLAMDCLVERWYAKAEHQGFTYDLRVVVQDGQMDFCLARLSKGPITNLHLNNHPLLVSELQLPPSVLYAAESLAVESVRLYPGLKTAGIDILLEKGSLRPRIIEMNGQGDLIYQDIYRENRIYRHQARMMLSELYGSGGNNRYGRP